MRRAIRVLVGTVAGAAVGVAPAAGASVDAGALRAIVDGDPFALRFVEAVVAFHRCA